MTIVWIIISIIIFSLLLIEPLMLFAIRKTKVINVTEVRPIIYHYGDIKERLYLIETDDETYISEIELPIYEDIKVHIEGRSIPFLGIFSRITEYESAKF